MSSNISTFVLNANLGFSVASLFAVSLALMFTLLKHDLDMRSYRISETEKRLEKFYIPTMELIEGIKERNFYIKDCNKSDIKDSLKKLNRWKYLINEENTKLKEQFTRFEDIFMKKMYLDSEDISHMNYLLDLIKKDIAYYENEIKGQLVKL